MPGAIQFGQDRRIQIGTGSTPLTYVTIGGEGSFDDKRSSDKLDLSSKDDGAYKATGYGQQEITLSPSGKTKLPDSGLAALHAASKTPSIPVMIRIVVGTTTEFECSMFVGNFSRSAPNNAPCTWQCDLSNNGAPATDDLIAFTVDEG